MKKLIYVLLIVVLLSSCSVFKKSSKKKQKHEEKNHTEQVTKSEEKQSKDTTKGISSQTSVQVVKKKAPYKTCSFKCKTSYKGMPVNITVRTTYDSIFWLSATSLGVEAVRAKCTLDSVFVTDKINKKNHKWSYSQASMRVGLPLSFDFIQEVFTDTTPIKSYQTSVFNGTIVKKLTKVQNISLPEQIIVEGKVGGKQQKYTLKISSYKLNELNAYPF